MEDKVKSRDKGPAYRCEPAVAFFFFIGASFSLSDPCATGQVGGLRSAVPHASTAIHCSHLQDADSIDSTRLDSTIGLAGKSVCTSITVSYFKPTAVGHSRGPANVNARRVVSDREAIPRRRDRCKKPSSSLLPARGPLSHYEMHVPRTQSRASICRRTPHFCFFERSSLCSRRSGTKCKKGYLEGPCVSRRGSRRLSSAHFLDFFLVAAFLHRRQAGPCDLCVTLWDRVRLFPAESTYAWSRLWPF